MKYLNRYNLPVRVIKIIQGKYKNHQPDPNRMSVTDLIKEPLIRTLYIEMWDKIQRDYSDFITMVQGTALHDRYELLSDEDDESEVKLEDNFGKFILVGKTDNKRDFTILDVKQTSVYNPVYKIPEWTKQLNIYAWQWISRGNLIENLIIDIWYRNWQFGKSHWKNYPKIPYEELKLELWSIEKQLEYINKQIKLHSENPYQECSNEQKGVRWEVYKNKNKTPSKVEAVKKDAEKWANKQDRKDSYTIKQSEAVMCRHFCKARSVCPYIKNPII